MFNYYGGKATLAKFYQRPRYKKIIEPFAGSAAYSVYHLQRDKSLTALLIDKNPKVVAAWDWLRGQTRESLLAMPCPKVGEVTTNFFVMCCAASTASTHCNKMTVTEMMESSIKRVWERMAYTLWILPRIEVICGSYTDIGNEEATWFVDPPYQTRNMPNGAYLGNGYARGCNAKDINFEHLGGWCKERMGQVIVAEKEGADWLPFKPFHYTLGSQGNKYCEVVWNNQPDEQMEFDFV